MGNLIVKSYQYQCIWLEVGNQHCVVNKMDENDVAAFFAGYESSYSDTESSLNDSFSSAWGDPDPQESVPTLMNTQNPEGNLANVVRSHQKSLSAVSSVKEITTSHVTVCERPAVGHGADAEDPIIFKCSCKSLCHNKFVQKELMEHYLNCRELSNSELDQALIAKLQVLSNNSGSTSSNHHKPQERQRASGTYAHLGRDCCRELFLKIHGVGKERRENLRRQALTNGLMIRQKKSGGRNSRAVSYQQHVHINTFLTNFAEQNGIKLPGRIPGKSFLNKMIAKQNCFTITG